MVSDIREAAVNNTRLACVAAAHRCHHALRHSSTALLRDIGSFVKIFDQTLRQNTDADVLRRSAAWLAGNIAHQFCDMPGVLWHGQNKFWGGL